MIKIIEKSDFFLCDKFRSELEMCPYDMDAPAIAKFA